MVDGDRLKELRLGRGLTQRQLEAVADVPQATISDLERGVPDRPSMVAVQKLAKALGVAFSDLLRRDEPAGNGAPTLEELLQQAQARVKELRQPVRIPVLSVSAHAHYDEGVPFDLGQFEIERYIDGGVEFEGRQISAVRVRGDCLAPDVQDGDLALFEAGVTPRDGKYVVALHEGALLVKRARVVDGRVVSLYDDADEWITVNGRTRVLGQVVETRRKM